MTHTLPAQVSTIVATMAAANRATSLKRAIASIRSSSSGAIRIIVVVNGNRRDAALCDWLGAQSDVRLEFLPTPSLPDAILRGRELVETPFFSTLDDDDEYIEGSLDRRLSVMDTPDRPDIVVSNGYQHSGGIHTLTYENMDGVMTHPLQFLLHTKPWLQSCNGLYRSASIGPDFFKDHHAYAEWTWLAFRLAMAGKKISVLDEPVYICHDTPASLSKSAAYEQAYMSLFHRMLALKPPADVVALIHRKMSAHWHQLSADALRRGEWREALQCHLKSLFLDGGLRYLSYSRRLLPGWPNAAPMSEEISEHKHAPHAHTSPPSSKR